MIRKIIHINEEKCNGCGACANACHEGAIQMVDGKARLMRDDFCDGLGDCLPACPTNAITFEEREADAYDDDAVKAHLSAKGPEALKKHLDAKKAHAHDNDAPAPHHGGCPGSMAREEGEESLTDTLSYLQEKKISWEVLKTAHHGSKNSTTEAFLENVKPRYAWISAGRKNRYGHPHKDTLERLENSGAKIYSTQENGAFGITVNKKSMRIHGRNG